MHLLQSIPCSDGIHHLILMPEGKSLSDTNIKELSCSQVISLVKELLHGVQFMHHCHVAHLDLKPDNLIINNDRLSIIDFGLARHFSSYDAVLKGFHGTDSWVAPEVGDQPFNPFAADVYAAGLIISKLNELISDPQLQTLSHQLMNQSPKDRLVHFKNVNLSRPRIKVNKTTKKRQKLEHHGFGVYNVL